MDSGPLEDGKPTRPGAGLELRLDTLAANVRRLREKLDEAEILAVVKADAYGHGVDRVAPMLAATGIGWFGVAFAAEGVELREAGIEGEILVLGPAQPEERSIYVRHRLTPVVSSLSQIEVIEGWGRRIEIHLKFDTGMRRLGVAMEEVDEALERVRGSEILELAGVLSHLGEADDLHGSETEIQERRFENVLSHMTARERDEVVTHLANSAAALHRPRSRHDLLRLGLSLYGYDPAKVVTGLEPVMTVHARIAHVRAVEEGERIGYAGRWSAARPSRIGIVPLGYADGYPWRLGGRADVLVRGRRAPVVGAVSMDMTFVDLTDTEAVLGDEVVLLGAEGSERIDAWELSERAGTIPYEIRSLLGLRLPRRYLTAPCSGPARTGVST